MLLKHDLLQQQKWTSTMKSFRLLLLGVSGVKSRYLALLQPLAARRASWVGDRRTYQSSDG